MQKKLRETGDQDFSLANRKKPHREFGLITGIKLDTGEQNKKRKKQRTTSPDLWEYTRLKYMAKTDLKLIRPDIGNEELSDIEEVEVEVFDKEPPFLQDHTTKSGIHLSPVRVVKVPDGSMQREALNAV